MSPNKMETRSQNYMLVLELPRQNSRLTVWGHARREGSHWRQRRLMDFSSIASYSSTRRVLVVKPTPRQPSGRSLRLWLRREGLPWIAARSSLYGQHAAALTQKRVELGPG
jgi:hypothetical protein